MKFSLYAVTVIALLAGLFYVFKPQTADKLPPPVVAATQAPAAPPAASSGAAPAAPAEPTAASTNAEAGAKTVDLVIAKGKLVSGPSVVQVKQNDRVVFHVKSDAADEIHLHGYNLHLRLKPRESATLDFIADKTGRFTYELHHADLELGALEIYPR
jgi:plastocyanin